MEGLYFFYALLVPFSARSMFSSTPSFLHVLLSLTSTCFLSASLYVYSAVSLYLLTLYSFCSLQLIASNMEGKSSPSEVLVCTTNPDKPGPPSTPCVTATTPYGFTVTWGKYTHPYLHTFHWTNTLAHNRRCM